MSRRRWTMLALVTFAHAGGALAVLSVAPLTPFLRDAFQLSRAQVGFLIPAVYVGGVIMSLPAGWLTDRFGVSPTLSIGLALAGITMMLAAETSTVTLFLSLLVAAGFGFSVLNPASSKAVVEWFPVRERGAAMGIKQIGLTLGGVIGALALPPIAIAFGWARALQAAGAAALVAAAAVASGYRRPPLGDASLATRARLTEIGLFLRRPGVLVVFVCGFLLSTVQSSVLAFLALYATDTFRVSAVEAGRLLALAQIGGTASRLAWGFTSDRFFGGRRRPGVVITACLGALAYGTFAVAGALPPLAVAAVAAVAGAGAFGWVGLYFTLVAEIGGARFAGLLTGVAVAFAWSGVLIGPPLFGLLLHATDSYTWPWTVLAVLALAVALTLPRPRPLVERNGDEPGAAREP